jgi:NADPH2:quinone reductase
MTSTHSTMTALVAHGGRSLSAHDAFVGEQRPIPQLRARDVLVRVQAVSVNPADTKTRNGLRDGSNRILGWDASGVVEAVGPDVTRFQMGDAVWYAGDVTRDGTNADLHAVDERIVGRKPTSLSDAEAAALPLTTITAWETLFERFQLTAQSTGTLLIIGGAGGVGSAMIQLAKQLTQVRVIATASREDSRAWVTELGADDVIDHHDLANQVRQVAPQGVNWLFSSHSRGNVRAFAEVLKPFGAITAIDQPSGLDLLPLKEKSIAWHWELMFTRARYETPDMGVQGELLDQVADLVDEGRLRSTLTNLYDGFTAENLRLAHQAVDSGRSVGKTVVSR